MPRAMGISFISGSTGKRGKLDPDKKTRKSPGPSLHSPDPLLPVQVEIIWPLSNRDRLIYIKENMSDSLHSFHSEPRKPRLVQSLVRGVFVLCVGQRGNSSSKKVYHLFTWPGL